jgi:hypothetical protein
MTRFALLLILCACGSEDPKDGSDTGTPEAGSEDGAGDGDGAAADAWSCNFIATYGFCYNYYGADGWDAASAESSCEWLENPEPLSDSECPGTGLVLGCENPSTSYFAHDYHMWYYDSHFTVDSASESCTTPGGTTYTP